MFDREDGKLYSGFRYSIVNYRQGIAIAIELGKIRKDAKEMVANLKRIMPKCNLDHNTDYVKQSKREASDTMENPIIYHLINYSNEKFNADVSRKCNVNFLKAYKGKFNNDLVIFMRQENQADVYLHYFYITASEKKLIWL